jgi:hypothetical protein
MHYTVGRFANYGKWSAPMPERPRQMHYPSQLLFHEIPGKPMSMSVSDAPGVLKPPKIKSINSQNSLTY